MGTHDWRDTGFWLDSWTTRKQCAVCGMIVDPEFPKENIEAAVKQREEGKEKALLQVEIMIENMTICQTLTKADGFGEIPSGVGPCL